MLLSNPVMKYDSNIPKKHLFALHHGSNENKDTFDAYNIIELSTGVFCCYCCLWRWWSLREDKIFNSTILCSH